MKRIILFVIGLMLWFIIPIELIYFSIRWIINKKPFPLAPIGALIIANEFNGFKDYLI